MNEATNGIGPSLWDVDAAVRSVLLDRASAARANGAATRSPGDVYAGRLLSLRQAETLPPGIREVRVSPGTVITPLAREHLKRLGIVVAFASGSGASGSAGSWGFAIEAVTGVVEAFRRSLLGGNDEWFDLGSSADQAIQWVADVKHRGALLLADEASTAVYRACRVAGVRAASVEDPLATARAARALGVNLLVVEPAGKSIALLRQIGATFRRGGGPVCPEWVERGLKS